MFVVDFAVSALERLPVGRNRRFESFSGKVNQSFILWEFHAEDLNGIFSNFFFGGLIIWIDFLDKRFRVLFFELVFFVDVVHLIVGHKFLLVH